MFMMRKFFLKFSPMISFPKLQPCSHLSFGTRTNTSPILLHPRIFLLGPQVLQILLKMPSKAELQAELTKLGVTFLPCQSILELSALLKKVKGDEPRESKLVLKKDYLEGLSTLRKETLLTAAVTAGFVIPKKVTKGDILLIMREGIDGALQEKLTFGKWKGFSILQSFEDLSYVKWALDLEDMKMPQLCRLKGLAQICFRGILRKIELDNVEEEDEPSAPLKKEKEEMKKELKKEKVKVKEEPAEETSKPQKFRLSDSSDSDLNEDQEKKKKTTDASDSAASWMELGEKRKKATFSRARGSRQ